MRNSFPLLLTMLVLPFCLRAAGDSAAIQDAIDRAAEPIVRLAAGEYAITHPIALKTGITLEGAGQERTFLRYRGGPGGAVVELRGIRDAGLCHLTLDGGSEKGPYAAQAIVAADAARLTIHHVTIEHFPAHGSFGPHGILFVGENPTNARGVTDSVVADCVLRDIGLGAEFGCAVRFSWGSSRNQALRNVIADTGRGGIFADNESRDIIIRGNTVSGSGGEGLAIEVWGGCDRSVIEDNRVDHWLSVGGCDDCAVRRNTVAAKDNYKLCGIEAIGSHLVITDNTVDGGAKIGLSVSNTGPNDHVYWARNAVRNCNQWGAQFQSEGKGLACHYLYKCSFTGMPVGLGPVWYPGDEGHGFRSNGACRNLVFEECEFSANGRLGIQFAGSGAEGLTFVHCVVKDNKGAAVSGLGAACTAAWEACVARGNANDALPGGRPFATRPPSAAFEAPASAKAGAIVTFDDRSSPAAGAVPAIAACLWDLGDGPPVFTPAATGAPARITHTYAAPGAYRVALVVWDAAGRGARAERCITVTE
jgi:hypothetical protein